MHKFFSKHSNAEAALIIAAQNGQIETVQDIITNGVNLDAIDSKSGATALLVAAQNGHVDIVKLLIQAGANLNRGLITGETPAFKAAANGHLQILLALIEAAADLTIANKKGITPVLVAAAENQVEILRVIGNDIKHPSGATPLMIAAQDGKTEAVQVLLEMGADPNATYYDSGATALFMAVQNGHIDVVNLLIQAGAHLNQGLITAETPVFKAAALGHIEILKTLIAAGADLTIANKVGITPAMIAIRNNHPDALKIITNLPQFDDQSFFAIAGQDHSSIIRLGLILGYFKEEETEQSDGCCRGLTMIWISECMIEKEERYKQITAKILLEENILPGEIQRVRNSIKKHEPLTNADEFLLQIPAFFEAVQLYQHPDQHSDLFNATFTQPDSAAISQIISSDDLMKRGNLARGYFEPGIYTKQELADYLKKIANTIDSIGYDEKENIGLVLSSCSHAIGLTYNTDNHCWKMMDINRAKIESFRLDETLQLSNRLVEQFEAALVSNTETPPNFPFIAISTEIYTTAYDKKYASLITQLENLKEYFPITDELAKREGFVNLAWKAALDGNAQALRKLAIMGANLDQTNPLVLNNTPLHIAAQHGYVNASEVILMAGVSPNSVNIHGQTPAYQAAQFGFPEVIRVLARFGANLEQPDRHGFTPAMRAAQEGHANVLKIIGNDIKHSGGATALLIAAQNGRTEAVQVLLEMGADPNAHYYDSGATALFMATQNGHIDVVNLLIQAGAHLNQGLITGETPIFKAAQFGHIEILKALINAGADLTIPNKNGITPMLIAFQNDHFAALEIITDSDDPTLSHNTF